MAHQDLLLSEMLLLIGRSNSLFDQILLMLKFLTMKFLNVRDYSNLEEI